MAQDVTWKSYFSDDERYADIINGIGCGGRQLVTKDDLQELDTQTGIWRKLQFVRKTRAKAHGQRARLRDMLRKVAFGVNFAIIGIENQETIDYSIALRNMAYDVGEYEKQMVLIRRKVRRNSKGLTRGEYLYGFKKDSKLKPVMTFILYSGLEEWDGPKTLHDLLDFTDIPEVLRERMPNYRINLVEIRKLKDTSIFKTDVRQVFDFIRCSEDDKALSELVKNDEYYKNMEEDAFDVVAHYTNATKLIESKNYYEGKDGKIDMCTAITKLIADGREEGITIGRNRGIDEKTRIIVHNMLSRNMSIQDICAIAECSEELVKEVSRSSLKKK